MRCPIGEDHYFFIHAKELGFQPYCHTGVLCDHYDHTTDTFYPGEKIVRQKVSEKLKQEGRQDVINAVKKSEQDPTKKTVIFYNRGAPFAGDELERRGVGGSESDIIYLAKEFYRQGNYNVRVYCDCLRPARYDGVWYKHHKHFTTDLADLNGVDLLIVSRTQDLLDSVPDLKEKYKIKHLVLWAHDMGIDPQWEGFEKVASKYDKVVMLSEDHKQDLLLRFPGLKADFAIIGDAVDHTLYEPKLKKIKGRCFYSSTPFRGLDILIEVWPKILQKVPHATLHIFSSIKTYGEHFDDSPWDHLYVGAKTTPGIKLHGSVPKKRLAREQMQSQLLLYPNTFRETYCITAAESQTAGTPVITTKLGALPETVKEGCGVLIDGEPYSEEYKQKFIDAAVELLTNNKQWNKMHKECLKHDFSWRSRIKEWIQLFFPNIQPKQDNSNQAQTFEGIKGKTDVLRDELFKKVITKCSEPLSSALNYGYDERKFNYFKQFINPKLKQKILIVNCGLGALPRFLNKYYPETEIWGTDRSLVALDYCRASNKKIFFANHPIDNPEFEPGYFDIIILDNAFQGFDLPKLFKQLDKVRKPQCVYVVAELMKTKEWSKIAAQIKSFGGELTAYTNYPGPHGPERLAYASWYSEP